MGIGKAVRLCPILVSACRRDTATSSSSLPKLKSTNFPDASASALPSSLLRFTLPRVVHDTSIRISIPARVNTLADPDQRIGGTAPYPTCFSRSCVSVRHRPLSFVSSLVEKRPAALNELAAAQRFSLLNSTLPRVVTTQVPDLHFSPCEHRRQVCIRELATRYAFHSLAPVPACRCDTNLPLFHPNPEKQSQGHHQGEGNEA